MTTRKTTKKRIALPEAARKEMILEAALEIFAKSGFERSDVDQIADFAKIGKGTIYRNFPSKLELFLALVEQGFNRLRERMAELASHEAPFVEKLERGLKLYVEFFLENPKLYRILIVERPGLRMRLDKTTVEGHQQFTSNLTKAIEKGIDEGELKPMNASFVASSLMSIAGVIIENSLYGSGASLDDDVKSAVDLVLTGIRKRRIER